MIERQSVIIFSRHEHTIGPTLVGYFKYCVISASNTIYKSYIFLYPTGRSLSKTMNLECADSTHAVEPAMPFTDTRCDVALPEFGERTDAEARDG